MANEAIQGQRTNRLVSRPGLLRSPRAPRHDGKKRSPRFILPGSAEGQPETRNDEYTRRPGFTRHRRPQDGEKRAMTKTSEAFGVLRALIALWRDILGTAKRAGTCDPPSEAAASAADFLVTGDKQDLLHLSHHEGARMITVRDFLALHKRLPLQKIRHH